MLSSDHYIIQQHLSCTITGETADSLPSGRIHNFILLPPYTNSAIYKRVFKTGTLAAFLGWIFICVIALFSFCNEKQLTVCRWLINRMKFYLNLHRDSEMCWKSMVICRYLMQFSWGFLGLILFNSVWCLFSFSIVSLLVLLISIISVQILRE